MRTQQAIALVEPFWTGHPETQLKLFTDVLLRREDRHLLIACPHPASIHRWLQHIPAQAARRCEAVPFTFCDDRSTYGSSSLANWARIETTLQEAEQRLGWSIGKVFVTWLDLFVCRDPSTASRLMPRPWVGLYLLPAHLRERTFWERLRRHRTPRMAKDATFFTGSRCQGLALLDEGVRGTLQALAPGIPVVTLPDVVDASLPDVPSPLAVRITEQAHGRPVIGLLGVLGRRKGTLTFLAGVLRSHPGECFFVMAGRLGPEERATYGTELTLLDSQLEEARKRGNVLLHLEPLPDEGALNAVVQACSVLYLAYDGHTHSSGLLGKAAHFGRTVIGPDRGCVSERIRRYRLGWRIAPDQPGAAAAVFHTIATPAAAATLRRARFPEYNRDHSKTQLEISLNTLIGECS